MLLEHRHVQQCPEAAEVDGSHKNGLAVNIGLFRFDVRNVDDLFLLDDATERGSRTRALRSAMPELRKLRRYADHCRRRHQAVLDTKQHAKTRVAEPD